MKAGEMMQAMVYNAMVHTMLLYGINSWVVTDVILKVLEGFHHLLDQQIAGM